LAIATDTPTVRAQAKWVRTSARKARVVAEHIRGRSVPEARAVLAFTPRAAARDIERVLASAVANAESRDDLRWRGEELFVASVLVDDGPTLKRWRARARGRVARIKKRTCHITVLLAPMAQEGLAAPPARRRARTPQPAAPEVTETKAPEAAEETPKQSAAKPAASKAKKTTSETGKPASAQAKRARRPKSESEES
jgi:large subunit ribosomal protein L22